MSTAKEPDAFDALERSQPDEPVFTLAARDPLAADLVMLWVERRRDDILKADPPLSNVKRKSELTKVANAEKVALDMTAWLAGDHAIEPELEDDENDNRTEPYTDEQLAAKAHFDDLINAKTRLNNAVGEIETATEILEPYGFEYERLMLTGKADEIKMMTADAIAPKRRGWNTTDYGHSKK